MALGGGTFTVQNKVLPGAYINFVSAQAASASLSDRGIATMALELDWGVDGEVFEVTNEDFQKNSLSIFGYEYTSDKLRGLRDLFLGARILYAYKLTSGGTKAANTFAVAKYSGIRGNDIRIVIESNADQTSKFDVKTLLGSDVLDVQTVAAAGELKSNRWVDFKSDAELKVTAGEALTGGTNGTVTGQSHQSYLDKIESYSFNTMGCVSTDEVTKGLYIAYNKRMREEMGKKFQTVVYNKAADYYGVINVRSGAERSDSEADLVYWVTGAQAGCEVNRSLHNRLYNGEFTADTSLTQSQLEAAIKNGEFVLHKVGTQVRVLEDINSMVTVSDTQGDVFKDNQTVRVIDQIGNDIAVIFNTSYLGTVPNDEAGRTSLWSDIVSHHQQLADIRAIEGFGETDVTVTAGANKRSVVVTDSITVINAMTQLYMTVTVG